MASCNFKKINKVTLFIEITVCLRKKWNEHRTGAEGDDDQTCRSTCK